MNVHRKAVWSDHLIWPIVVVASAAHWSCFRNCLIDDAFITLQYASNLVHHRTWGFLPGVTMNTATSPLNVLLLAVIGLVARDMVVAAVCLATMNSVAMCVALRSLGSALFQSYFFSVLTIVAFLANPLIVSTLGMESLLYLTLMTVSLLFFVRRKPVLLAITLALMTLTRPDAVLLTVVLLVLFRPAVAKPFGGRFGSWGRNRLVMVAIYLLVLLPWHLFSWIWLGSVVPDTLFIKLSQLWPEGRFGTGLSMYAETYLTETLFSFVLVPFGALAFLARDPDRRRLALAIAAFASLYWIAYAYLDVPPYHWYYAPLAGTGIILGGLGAATAFDRAAPGVRLVRGLLWMLVPICTVGISLYIWREGGITFSEPPLHTNWAPQRRYREIGFWLREHLPQSETVLLEGEVGTVSFYSQRLLMDVFTDPSREFSDIARLLNSTDGLKEWLLAVNFRWRPSPMPAESTPYVLAMFNNGHSASERPGQVVQRWAIDSRWRGRGEVVLFKSGPRLR